MTQPVALEHGHSPEEVHKRLREAGGSAHLKDFVYGSIDGTVTTFAIVAGVEGAGLPYSVIVALGLANVLADGFSMAAGNYTGTKAELDNRRRLAEVESRHIRLVPEGEREELRQILERIGLHGPVLGDAVRMIAANKGKWVRLMLTEEYGLPAARPRPMRSALATFAAFVAAGVFPLMPYILSVSVAFAASIGTTALVFAVIGACKSRWSQVPMWKSALETLVIGGSAAAIAYGVGAMFHP